MWVGRDTVPTYLVQRRSGRHLILPQRARTCGSNTECKDKCGYYKGPVTLVNHVNKGLSLMWAEKTRAKLSYNSITQKMTLHMTPSTYFTVPYHSALVRMLGFEPSVVSRPPAADMTRMHVYPRLGGTDIVLTPSTSVVLPFEETPDGSYTYRKEAENVVHMDQGFDTIYVYTDVVASRIVGDSLVPLLRALSVSGSHGATVSDRFTNVPVLYSHFHSIEMDIRNDTGRRIPFEYGRVTVTLHFRRRRTGLFCR